MARKNTPEGPSGLIVVDKDAGGSSHAVVARMRRLAGTRKVGHAGTLDPMATGVLILGINKATKLLTWLVGETKTYSTVIRLGVGTMTDDAEGDALSLAATGRVEQMSDQQILRAVQKLTGDIMQVPSSVSAIKVDGVRSYARVRSGQEVSLPARPVSVSEFRIEKVERLQVAPPAVLVDSLGEPVAAYTAEPSVAVIDVHATISCSSGTYIRALARDLGAQLELGGHLTRLRRTRVGEILVENAHSLSELEEIRESGQELPLLTLEDAARQLFSVRLLSAEQASDVSNGRRIAPSPSERVNEAQGSPSTHPDHASTVGVSAAFAPNGELVALLENTRWKGAEVAAPILVFEAGKTYEKGN